MKKLLVYSMAVAMLLGFGLLSSPAQAQPVDINDGGIGDVLLFSIYDVRDNVEDDAPRSPAWQNYIAIENTTGAWTAFHLRFRAWKKSIEVWDHIILLSPYDVFWMYLKKDAGNYVRMYSEDTETLKNSGLIWGNDTTWTDYFKPDLLQAAGFCMGDDACLENEMRTGYVEVIGLWQLSIPPAECNLDPWRVGECDEDTHQITDIVKDVNKFTGEEKSTGLTVGGINVYDVQDALFYRFVTYSNYVNEWNQAPLNWTCQYTNCVDVKAGAVVIDADWPRYQPAAPVTPVGGPAGADWQPGNIVISGNSQWDGCYEASCESYPENQRYGLDCGNVLAGVLFMTDADTGRFQMENYIALTDFRTDQWFLQPLDWMYYAYTLTNPNFIQGGSDDLGIRDYVEQNTNTSRWVHRDGYPGGGIFFPASTMFWFYGYAYTDVNRVFAGGDESTFLWYYVFPNYATTVGPTLADGDDLYGSNWNDINVDSNPWYFPITNIPVDQYGYTQPLGDVGPINWEAIADSTGYFVHYFNDIFSIDDVEAALNKGSIWYTHWTVRKADGANVNVTTDVILTYPTKHHHWFFADWPLMWQFQDATQFDVTNTKWNLYLNNVWEYLGSINNPQTNQEGLKRVEKLIVGIDHASNPGNFNNTVPPRTLAEWFKYKYFNGRIYAKSYLWDANQRLCPGSPPDAPPPSPVPPDLNELPIPHEVNIVRVGESEDHTGIGLGEANHLLACGKGLWAVGHWLIGSSYLERGQRNEDMGAGEEAPCTPYVTPDPSWDGFYPVPAIGVVIVQNDLGASSPVTRSAMAEWHYTSWEGWCE